MKHDDQFIRKTIAVLTENGYSILSVHDGEERFNLPSHKEAFEVLTSVDESRMTIIKDGERVTLYFVLGNSPGETLSDAGGTSDEAMDKVFEIINPIIDKMNV
jgi:hypothetical protein